VPLYKNRPPIRVIAPVPEHMRERLAACGWTDRGPDARAQGSDRKDAINKLSL